MSSKERTDMKNGHALRAVHLYRFCTASILSH